jgi:hypothetical protein
MWGSNLLPPGDLRDALLEAGRRRLDVIRKPSGAARLLHRVLDNVLSQMNDDDLSDLFERVQTERQRRWIASYGPQLVPCANCGFVRCACFDE